MFQQNLLKVMFIYVYIVATIAITCRIRIAIFGDHIINLTLSGFEKAINEYWWQHVITILILLVNILIIIKIRKYLLKLFEKLTDKLASIDADRKGGLSNKFYHEMAINFTDITVFFILVAIMICC